MLKKMIKYVLAAVAISFVAYNSVYFKKLSEVKASAVKQFNAAVYARTYFDTKLSAAANEAPEADMLLTALKNDAQNTIKTNSHALDIGNIRFFMMKGQGTVTSIDENDVTILTKNQQSLKIAIEYVFGNALRDAPGIIQINNFSSTMDLNNIAAEVDKIVRTEVLPAFKSKVKKGDLVAFDGAFELNQQHINLNNIEIMPVHLQIIKP